MCSVELLCCIVYRPGMYTNAVAYSVIFVWWFQRSAVNTRATASRASTEQLASIRIRIAFSAFAMMVSQASWYYSEELFSIAAFDLFTNSNCLPDVRSIVVILEETLCNNSEMWECGLERWNKKQSKKWLGNKTAGPGFQDKIMWGNNNKCRKLLFLFLNCHAWSPG